MKEENKPDNLEQFFQRILSGHEEDPGTAFWDRIAPNIPPKPGGKSPFVYKGWMLVFAFLFGLLFSAMFFNWQSNTRLIAQLETQLIAKETKIVEMAQTITELKNVHFINKAVTKQEKNALKKTSEITRHSSAKISSNLNNSKNSISDLSGEKEQIVKLEVTRKTGVGAAAKSENGGSFQPFKSKDNIGHLFNNQKFLNANYKSMQLLYDNQLISNSFFAGNNGIYKQKNKLEPTSLGELAQLPAKRKLFIDNPLNILDLTASEKKKLLPTPVSVLSFGLGDDDLTSFLSFSVNPFSSYKYNLKGFEPKSTSLSESAGITTSWNWSVYGGFETKSKWSVQVGFDFNKLVILKESINNVRFNSKEATKVNEGYLFSLTQRSDGALGQVVVNSNIYNQLKNDGNDILNGDLFKISISTEQPIQIVRLPIMGGYRIDLSKRLYVTPKLGVSAVWKTKDQTQLRSISTFSERISIQRENIFLTTKVTTESLEAIFRTEFGYRWRPRWYLVAEPRFKYSGKGLFNYKNLELVDSPFHLMFGIRFNID